MSDGDLGEHYAFEERFTDGAWNHRIQIHFLPAYSPETNPIERVCWHLHETITRNHRCATMEELGSLACEWLASNNNHYADMRNTFAVAA
jgi:transposase